MTNTQVTAHVTIVQPDGDVYHGWVIARTADTITLDYWTAWYDGDDAPYIAPSGDLVSVRVGEDTMVQVND